MKKKTVWVIERGEYSDYRVEGVFTSKKNAVLVQGKIGGDVAEWELDPGVDDIRRDYHEYCVLMLRDGTVESIDQSSLYSLDPGEGFIWDRPNAPAFKGKGIPKCLRASVHARNEKHAIKIVGEIRARMIAENKWE